MKKYVSQGQTVPSMLEKPEEIKELLKAGFEYVTQKDGLTYFRKRGEPRKVYLLVLQLHYLSVGDALYV